MKNPKSKYDLFPEGTSHPWVGPNQILILWKTCENLCFNIGGTFGICGGKNPDHECCLEASIPIELPPHPTPLHGDLMKPPLKPFTAASKSLSILLLCLHESLAKEITIYAESMGHKVNYEKTSTEGLKEMRKKAVIFGTPYDIVFVDVDLLNEPPFENWKTPGFPTPWFIIMTPPHRKRQIAVPVDGVLLKPIKRKELEKCFLEWKPRSDIPTIIWESPIIHRMKQKTLRESTPTTTTTNSNQGSPSGSPKPNSPPLKNSKFVLDVLVAEDNPVSQQLLQRFVQNSGHNCFVVQNGKEAVEFVRNRPVDLIFMDCRMPVMDGYEATQKIREYESKESGGHTPIIALTADVLSGTHERCLQCGMDDYLPKPIRKVVVEEIIENLSIKMKQDLLRVLPVINNSSTSNSPKKSTRLLALTVEDNTIIAKITRVILERHGFQVEAASNGKVALDLVMGNHNKYHVILMDMIMPIMTGVEATQHIRKFESENGLPPVPIIAITGNKSPEFRKLCFEIGCNDFHKKPVDWNDLVKNVKHFGRLHQLTVEKWEFLNPKDESSQNTSLPTVSSLMTSLQQLEIDKMESKKN